LLLDERIEALLDALDEGQQLWRRVQSAVSMLLGGNTGQVCFALITSLLTGRSVLNARQMLLVNMLTDALPAAALAVSPQTGTAQVDFDEAALWRAIGIRGASTTLSACLAWLKASVTGHAAARLHRRADRPGGRTARTNPRRLARPTGAADGRGILRGIGAGGQHPRLESGVRMHTGRPAGLGSSLPGDRGGDGGVRGRSGTAFSRFDSRGQHPHQRHW
jgi:hypothetical protein